MAERRVHELKCEVPYFAAVKDGSKTFELRLNDRGYQAGDLVVLREYIAEDRRYRHMRDATFDLTFRIGYVLPIDDGRVVFSLLKVRDES